MKKLTSRTQNPSPHWSIVFTLIWVGIMLAVPLRAASNNQVHPDEEKSLRLQLLDPSELASDARWYLSFDNDFLAPKNRDQDYTYGINFAYASDSLQRSGATRLLGRIDQAFGLGEDRVGKTLEFGLYGFTPANVGSTQADPNDRPYASLVYVSTTSESMDWENQTVLRSQLTIGVLGLDVVGNVQNFSHRLVGGGEAQGWRHQISNGGEPTFRYSVARQQRIASALDRAEFKHTLAASVGYVSEVSWSLGMRAGRISTTWHSFQPEVKNYAESVASQRSRAPESYFWAGMAVKARAYNAFLQGQFRDSEVTYDYGELRPLVVEAWAGYTHEFMNGYHINYGLRGHTSEIREGNGDRNVIWGGLMVGKAFL